MGNLQLWLPHERPRTAIVATGTGSLLWDLSALDIDSGLLTPLVTNPTRRFGGIVGLVLGLVLHVLIGGLIRLLSLLTAGLLASTVRLLEPLLAQPPSAPVQFFVDVHGECVGTAEAAIGLSGSVMRFCRRGRKRD